MRQAISFGFVLISCLTVSKAAEPQKREWTIGGDRREAMVFVPEKAKTEPAPLVLVFHGHGGSMNSSMRSFGIHRLWPDAIVVYPQGLKTPGLLTDPEGKRSGWQSSAGQLGDRDLKFVDRIIADIKAEVQVDPKRIYATGHSNGGGFTYLLWAERGDVFAAMAPSAAAGLKHLPKLKPKPMLHIAGEADALVRFPMQIRMIEQIKSIDGCMDEGKPWNGMKWCKRFDSKSGTPVVTMIHPGGHNFERTAPEAIVRFFNEYPPKPAKSPEKANATAPAPAAVK